METELFPTIKQVAFDIQEAQRSLYFFDAIAARSDELNKRKDLSSFSVIQFMAIDHMIIAIGRIFSSYSTDHSLEAISKYARKAKSIDITSAEDGFKNVLDVDLKFSNTDEIKTEIEKICPRRKQEEVDRIIQYRNKFVAHKDRTIKRENIGAKFDDVERIISKSFDFIDLCSLIFLNLSPVDCRYSRHLIEGADNDRKRLEKMIDILLKSVS